jgi:hypothetical protein
MPDIVDFTLHALFFNGEKRLRINKKEKEKA